MLRHDPGPGASASSRPASRSTSRLHPPDPVRQVRRGEGVRGRPEGHDDARPRLQREAENAIADGAAGSTQRPGGGARRDGPPDRRDPRDGGRPELGKSKVNFATGTGLGPAVGLGVQGVHAGRRDAAGYDLNAYWNGPSTIGIPQCPDPSQPDGAWHPVNAGDGEAGTFTLFGATAHSVNTIFAQVIAQLGPSTSSTWPTRSASSPKLPDVVLDHARVGRREPARDDQRVRDARRPRRAALGDAAAPRELGGGTLDDSVGSQGAPSARRERRQPGDRTRSQGVVRGGTGTSAASRHVRSPARPARPTRTSTPGSADTPCRS